MNLRLLGAPRMRGGGLSSAAGLPSAREVPSADGSGRSSVTIRLLPSKTAERDSTERKVHPEVRSPSLHSRCDFRCLVEENRNSTVFADNRSNQGERRQLQRDGFGDRNRRRHGRGGDRRRPRTARRGEERAIASSRKLGNGDGPQRIPGCRDFGRRRSRVGRRFAAHVRLRAFGLDCGERDLIRLRFGQGSPPAAAKTPATAVAIAALLIGTLAIARTPR